MNGETTMGAEPQRTFPQEAPAAVRYRRGQLDLPQPFRLASGQAVSPARLAWQCVGPDGAPVIVALGGISAHRRVCDESGAGWWEAQTGPGRALDTTRYRVLCADWLGGCDASSTATQLEACVQDDESAEAPVVSTGDQARALLLLLNRLGVRRVHLLVGASYGGNVAQHFAALLGERLRRLVLLSAAHKPAQFGLALRHVQRAILDLGADAPQALALARSLAVLCYRTTEGVERRFAEDRGRGGITGWLEHHGGAFVRRFDADAYRCLGRSLDAHAFDPAALRVPTTVFAVREDLTVPLSLLREFAARAGGPCELVEISSPHGHDAFLKEVDAVARVLADALREPA